MSLRKIMVPLSGANDEEAVLDTGLLIGRRLQAHVEAFHAAVDSRDAVAFVGEGMTSAMIEQIMTAADREGRERSGRVRSLFERLSARHGAPRSAGPVPGFSVALVERAGREDDLVAERGRLADLIIAGKPPADDGTVPPLALEAALRETGRPVLIVPPGAGEFGKVIAIAWNGSVEVSRAVAYSMPFLAEAERVVVLSLEEEHTYRPSPAETVEYLAWHGLAATSAKLAPAEGSQGQALLAAAAKHGADMMVQGAYTRSHMRRLIFGGVTGEVLARTTIPVLLTH